MPWKMIFSLNMYPNAHSLCILSFIPKIFPKEPTIWRLQSCYSVYVQSQFIWLFWQSSEKHSSCFFELRERRMKLRLVYYVCLLLFNVCPPKTCRSAFCGLLLSLHVIILVRIFSMLLDK